jgi:hypothetical protein
METFPTTEGPRPISPLTSENHRSQSASHHQHNEVKNYNELRKLPAN